jgi:hypothetical protein
MQSAKNKVASILRKRALLNHSVTEIFDFRFFNESSSSPGPFLSYYITTMFTTPVVNRKNVRTEDFLLFLFRHCWVAVFLLLQIDLFTTLQI